MSFKSAFSFSSFTFIKRLFSFSSPLKDGFTDLMDTVWASSERWWRTGKPGILQYMGSKRVRYNWATEQQCISVSKKSELFNIKTSLCHVDKSCPGNNNIYCKIQKITQCFNAIKNKIFSIRDSFIKKETKLRFRNRY